MVRRDERLREGRGVWRGSVWGRLVDGYPNLVAAGLFTVCVVVAAWPILQRLNRVVVGDDIDVYINLWADWWALKAWGSGELSLWWSDYLFYPLGADLSYHSFSHLNTAVSLLLRPLFGVVGAYNVTILANYVLIALSMFQLARYWTGSWTAGVAAGIVFAFNSHALYQSCHPVLLSIWVLPWVTLYLVRGWHGNMRDETRRRGRRDLLVAGAFIFLAALVSVLMLIFAVGWAAVVLGALVLERWVESRRKKEEGDGRSLWLSRLGEALALLAVSGGLPALLVVWPVLGEWLLAGDGSFVTDPTQSLVTDLASLATPHWVNWYVRGIYVGIAPAALALLALGRWRRGRARPWPWLALFGVALLVAIGPVPVVDGEALDVYLPWSAWAAALLRNTYRLNILVSLGLAMLAALGWTVVRDALPRRRWVQGVAAALVLGLVLVDYLAVGMPYTRLSVPRFYAQTLAAMPEETVVAIVPTGRQVDKVHLFYQTVHGKRMSNGVVSRAEARAERFVRDNGLLRAGHYHLPPQELPADPARALRELAAVGVDLLVIEKGWQGVDVAAWRAVLGDEVWYEDEAVLVYRVRVGD